MNLISCDGCGVILDKDKLNFPDDIWDDMGCIDQRYGDYNQKTKDFEAYLRCPVCDHQIFAGKK